MSLSATYRQLNLAPLESELRLNCLRQYGHLERGDKWISKCTHLEIGGFNDRGGPRKRWIETVTKDLEAWNIDANNVHD